MKKVGKKFGKWYDLSTSEEKAVILEKDLFHTVCPDLIRSAVEILDEFLEEQKQ